MNLQPQLPGSKAAVLYQVDFTHYPSSPKVAQRLYQLGVADPVQLIAEALAEYWLLEQPDGRPVWAVVGVGRGTWFPNLPRPRNQPKFS